MPSPSGGGHNLAPTHLARLTHAFHVTAFHFCMSSGNRQVKQNYLSKYTSRMTPAPTVKAVPYACTSPV